MENPVTFDLDSIRQRVFNLFDNDYAYNSSLKVEVRNTTHNSKPAVEVEVSTMYERPKLESSSGMLDLLLRVRDAIGTEELDEGYVFGHGGCETCDFGSKYGYTFIGFNK